MASITLKVLSGGAEGRVAAPDADVIRIGRAAESELALPDAHVAPLHARLHLGDAEVVLEAVEGSAGTWIERRGARFALGAERARCFIENGDVVELGAPGDAGTRVLVTVEPDRDRGRLLTLRPLAELGSSAVNEAERLRALLEALRRIGGADDLESATTALAEAALELVPRATHAAVTLRDEGNQGEVVTHGLSPVALRVRTASGEPAPPEAPFPIPRSILRRVSRERAAVLVANAPDEAMSSESLLGASIYSTMGVPLWKGDDLLGVLQVDSRGAPAMFGGTDLDVLGVLAANASLAIANARLIRRLSAAEQELKKENTFLRRRERTRSGDRRIVGESRVMQELFRKLDKVKDTRVSVLVQGETGTGKELVARALHESSNRRERLFVAQNCAAIPENLLESELFGHKRGAFTGATEDKKGLFEMADGGTLFLDEIGELPLSLQAKLLRALQEGEVRPLGGSAPRRVDVRIVAATNRDLETEVREGRFREDLYYRLKVYPLQVPPLRERREDVPLLAAYFLGRYEHEFGKKTAGFEEETRAALVAYDWPGNVRELENEVQRLVIQAEPEGRIGPELLSPRVRQIEGVLLQAGKAKGTLRAMIDQVERQVVLEALREHGGNKTAAAKALGITREGLHKKIKQLGIG